MLSGDGKTYGFGGNEHEYEYTEQKGSGGCV